MRSPILAKPWRLTDAPPEVRADVRVRVRVRAVIMVTARVGVTVRARISVTWLGLGLGSWPGSWLGLDNHVAFADFAEAVAYMKALTDAPPEVRADVRVRVRVYT